MWSRSNNVYQAALPPYDARDDRNCRKLVQSAKFRRHWGNMEQCLEEQKNPITPVNRHLQKELKDLPRLVRKASEEQKAQINVAAMQMHYPSRPSTVPSRKRCPYTENNSQNTKYDAMFQPRGRAPDLVQEVLQGRTDAQHSNVSQLALTYMRTLEKSEDFTRREFTITAKRQHQAFLQRIGVSMEYLEELRQKHVQALTDETDERTVLEDRQTLEREHLMLSAAQNGRRAKLNEEVFPTCPCCVTGEGGVIPSAAKGAFLLDIRWSGSAQLQLLVLGFDEKHKLLGCVASGCSIKDSLSQKPVIRSWGDYNFGGANIRGPRRTVEVMLQHLSHSHRYHRFVFCVMDENAGKMRHYDRCYLTVRESNGEVDHVRSNTDLTERWATKLPLPGTHSCVVVASIVREEGEPTNVLHHHAHFRGVQLHRSRSFVMEINSHWKFISHNKLYQDIHSYQQLSPILVDTLLMTLAELQTICIEERWSMIERSLEFVSLAHCAQIQQEETLLRAPIVKSFNEQLSRLKILLAPQKKEKGKQVFGRKTSMTLIMPKGTNPFRPVQSPPQVAPTTNLPKKKSVTYDDW